MVERSPWMKFYVSDWRADPELRSCSLSARGLWLELIAIMHNAEPYGHLIIGGQKPSTSTIASLAGATSQAVVAALAELRKNGVSSVTDGGVIYSRRMVRDHAKALADKENGKRGGNPKLRSGLTRVGGGGVNPPVKAEDKAHIPEARSQKNTLSNESVARPRKRVATDDTLPSQLTPAMAAHAASHGFVNGSAERLFTAWRDHHLAKGTVIADTTASFRTWVGNELKFNPRSNGHGQQPSQPAKLYGVSAANAEFRARSNRGAVAALRELGAVGDDGLWSAPNGDRDEGS